MEELAWGSDRRTNQPGSHPKSRVSFELVAWILLGLMFLPIVEGEAPAGKMLLCLSVASSFSRIAQSMSAKCV